MVAYRVVRIYAVSAHSRKEALEKVRADAGKYLTAEFAKEVEHTGWMGSLKKQLTGGR